MPSTLHFRCPHCAARIKASVAVSGQNRACPACHEAFTVPRPVPQDEGPVLVLHERDDRFELGMTRGARSGRPYVLRVSA